MLESQIQASHEIDQLGYERPNIYIGLMESA